MMLETSPLTVTPASPDNDQRHGEIVSCIAGALSNNPRSDAEAVARALADAGYLNNAIEASPLKLAALLAGYDWVGLEKHPSEEMRAIKAIVLLHNSGYQIMQQAW